MAALDLQPVEESTSKLDLRPALDLQPVEDAPPVGSDGRILGGTTPPSPSFTDLVKEQVTTPFVAIPKPSATAEDSSLTRFGKGLAQSGIGAAEGLETPLGVSLAAASALPVVGKVIGRTAAAGFGIKSTLEGFKEAAEAYQSGDMEKAGKALGDLIVGGAMVRGSVAAPKTTKAIKDAQHLLHPHHTGHAPVTKEIPEVGPGITQAVEPSTLVQIPGLKPGEMPVPPEPGTPPVVEPAPVPEPPRFTGIPVIGRLNELRRGLGELNLQRPARREISATYDSIANEANIAGRQAQRKIELKVPDELDRQALTAVVQAPDLAKMTGDAVKVEASDAPEALKKVYRHAVENYDRLRKFVPEINALHEDQLAAERGAGIETDSIDNYIAQRWDFDTMLGENKPVVIDATGGKGGGSTFFKKQRVLPDYATGIAEGYVPKSLDAAALASHRIRAGQMLVNQRAWAESLRNVENPIDGKPAATDLIAQPKGTKVAPSGYEYADVFNQPMALHESFAPLVKALTGASQVPKVVNQVPAFVKHGLLFFDTFHGSRLAQMAAASGVKPSILARNMKGLSILEYSADDLKAAVAANEITPEVAAYAEANRSTLEAGVSAGLNVARISDALYKDVVAKVPVVGGYTKWLFDKFQRGLMAETYINWRARNERIYPDESAKDLDFRTAREVNTFYRNLGSQGVFKSKTWQDTARLIALAPQWVEGGVRSEAGAYAQAGQVPFDIASGNARVGNLARTAGTGLLAYAAITQIINLATTGHPTWENPEGHKSDAYVPDWLSESEGYWFSPLSVFAEGTHDFLKYDQQENSILGTVAHISGNKLQPVIRAGIGDLLLGKDYFDRPLPTSLDRFKQAGYDLLPVPIPISALYAQRPGQAQQTIMSSAGLKADKVKSEKSELGMRNALVEEQLQFLVAKARLKPVEDRLPYIIDERDRRIKEDDIPIFNRKLQELLRKKVIQRE